MFTLANVASGSVGMALFAAISWEGVKAMVLFAPRIKEKLRAEGRSQAEAEAAEKWELARQVVEQATGKDLDELMRSNGQSSNNGKSRDAQ
jgi:hypothetical protein